MKSQFFPLLKYELLRFTWLIPVIYGLVIYHIFRAHDLADKTDYMFSLDAGGQQINTVMLMWFSFSAIFFATGYMAGPRTTGMVSPLTSGFDFFFSRAIDRRLWFAIKTGLFLLIVMTPTLIGWRAALNSPTVRIELPYNSVEARKHMTAFYLANFEDAHLQTPDTGRNEDYVVLPHGKPAIARFFVAGELLILIFFQGAAFIFWPRGWTLGLAFLVALAVVSLIIFPSSHMPSRYEEGVAFCSSHFFSTCFAVGFLYLISQLYCGWRFVRAEMTS